MPRSLLAVALAVLAVLTPAAIAQAAPTLSFDQPCYSPGDDMTFSGTGYTPNGQVNIFFSLIETQRFGQYDTQADAAGALDGKLDTPDVDSFLGENDWSGTMGAAANDRTRVDAGAPPEESVGLTTFTLSRWAVQLEQPNGARPRAGRPMIVTAKGFTNARGETLYVHYRRSRRTMKTVKLGRLTGDCGDRTKRLARGLPRGLRPGRYELVFNTTRRNPQAGPRINQTLRLR